MQREIQLKVFFTSTFFEELNKGSKFLNHFPLKLLNLNSKKSSELYISFTVSLVSNPSLMTS